MKHSIVLAAATLAFVPNPALAQTIDEAMATIFSTPAECHRALAAMGRLRNADAGESISMGAYRCISVNRHRTAWMIVKRRSRD